MHEIFTIGHAARPWEEFVDLLYHHGITLLADIRRFPGSRHAPQFNEETLGAALADEGIGYRHLPALGGRRRARPDSPNTGWRHPSFQGYADYMETEEFQAGLHELMDLAQDQRVAIMCAEAVPWRCHRRLVGDTLVVRGVVVRDIISESTISDHTLTPFAAVNGLRITYPEVVDA